jgi:hypothetical protein
VETITTTSNGNTVKPAADSRSISWIRYMETLSLGIRLRPAKKLAG